MNGKELLEDMSFVHGKYVEEAEEMPPAQRIRTVNWKKPLMIAAIIGLMVILMGSASGVWTILAASDLFDYPLVDPARVDPEDVSLTATDVSAASMRVRCQVNGVEYGVNSIYILANGPFVIEKQADGQWVPLEPKVDDDLWKADEVLTDGSTDWYVDWSGMYGILEPGRYRYVATVLKGNEPFSVEFSIEDNGGTELLAEIDRILNEDSYGVRFTLITEFGSMDALNEDEISLIRAEYMDDPYVYEYWKYGEDLLHMIYKGNQPWIGMMYKDGIKYSLDHEGDDRTKPVIGWSPNPDLDLNRLTEWVSLMPADPEEMEPGYSPEGRLEKLVMKQYEARFMDHFDVEATNICTWEFITFDPSVAAAELARQNVDVAREFSWKEDRKNMKSLDVAFVNTTPQPVTTASEAIARAMAECTVDHDKILCYRDEKEGMWKVEFQIMYGYQGYQFVYMNDEGITQMISGAGSKEPLWQDLYPGP